MSAWFLLPAFLAGIVIGSVVAISFMNGMVRYRSVIIEFLRMVDTIVGRHSDGYDCIDVECEVRDGVDAKNGLSGV